MLISPPKKAIAGKISRLQRYKIKYNKDEGRPKKNKVILDKYKIINPTPKKIPI